VTESAFPQGPRDQRELEARADVLVYSSDVLAAPLEVIGQVRMELWIESTAPSTDFTARLVDVYPDGRAMGVCDGIRRCRRLTPDVPTKIEISLSDVDQVFQVGHRLRLDVSSSNFPRFGRRARDESAPVIARQTVHHSQAHPSCLRLPVRGGSGDESGHPRSG
jgi:putative CocE/NonD family hydrolase